MIVRLLEKEALLFPSSDAAVSKCDPWREKVIHWFFSVVSALGRNQPAGVDHPFNRATVHVTTALMDSYLASLSCERSARFRRDRMAYQVLATSCLLLGMRLVHNHQWNEVTKQQEQVGKEEPHSEMKRTHKHHENMDQQVDRANDGDVLEIPNASAILRISAASKSISEEHVVSMVREITSSRVFPCCQSVTALDFIRVFTGRNRHANLTSSPDRSLLLEPIQERNASLLADTGLFCLGCRPSIVACAAITIAMIRSVSDEHNMSCVRRLVFHSIFGEHGDVSAWQLVRDVENRLLLATTVPLRNDDRVARRDHPAAHVIPQEE